MKIKLTLAHLYPSRMNLYGDLGNIVTLQRRCAQRNIDIEIINIEETNSELSMSSDIYFFGGGQDQDQIGVYNDLIKNKKKSLLDELNNKKVMLAICGGYQLLGNYFLTAKGESIEGIGVLPIETIAPGPELSQRAIGNIITDCTNHKDLISHYTGLKHLVGFENHSGRTKIVNASECKVLGKVLVGSGDNSDGIGDGIRYKNIFGSYMHGSLLPKNPHLADLLIEIAVNNKYKNDYKLEKIDDSEEMAAHNYILQRYNIK